MNTSLVITTINKPNKNILSFDQNCKKKKWSFIVIGDKKTPKNFKLNHGDFYSVKDQKFLKDSDEAINVCLDKYPDNTSKTVCALRYLQNVKGYSYEELNKRAARQGYF